tara:strand:+ start:7473 stop:7724 length:252 start_codon:yes stop_codon:yes gene_type:complete
MSDKNIDKSSIKQKIDNLKLLKQNKRHFINLFNIIQKYNSKYTDNMNGIFFNLNELSESVLLELQYYLNNIDYTNNESETDTI